MIGAKEQQLSGKSKKSFISALFSTEHCGELSPLPEIRDGEKDLYLQLAHPGPLHGRQVIYSACQSCQCLGCALAVRLEVGVWKGF